MENGTKLLFLRCLISVRVDIPFFRGSSAIERGDLKSEGKRRSSIICHDSDEAEVILRTISVNQLSINAAVADMCGELARSISGSSKSTGRLVAQNNSETRDATRNVDNKSNSSD